MSAEFTSNTTVFLTIPEVGKSRRFGIWWRGFTLWLLPNCICGCFQMALRGSSKQHSSTGAWNLCPTKMKKSNVPLSVWQRPHFGLNVKHSAGAYVFEHLVPVRGPWVGASLGPLCFPTIDAVCPVGALRLPPPCSPWCHGLYSFLHCTPKSTLSTFSYFLLGSEQMQREK